MFNFQATIGVEVHTVLNTKTKMFSSAPNCRTDAANVNLHVIDLGLPGTMPAPNKQAIVKALRLAQALRMKEVNLLVRFDRKNYFYQDLPKGFQITQQYHPFAKDGSLTIVVNNRSKQVLIERFHLEEDTAKQFNTANGLYLDYNRCGAPLIEIVTNPVFENALEVKAYLIALRQVLLHNNISDAKMEEGSMRADINVSVRPIGSKNLGTRVEIKNINSFNNVEKAINYEIKRQIESLLSGVQIVQSTYRYDDTSQTTVFMRKKTIDVDYRYMTEANILQIQLDKNWVQTIYDYLPKQPEAIIEQLKNLQIDPKQIDQLLDSQELLQAFNYVNDEVNNPKEVVRWLLTELLGLVNKKENNTFEHAVSSVDLNNLITLINLLSAGEINGKQAKKILEVSYENKKSPQVLISELNMVQIKDKAVLIPIVNDLIEKSKENITKNLATRKERVQSMLLGLLMKETNGQANPDVANEVVNQLLNEKFNSEQ